MREEREYRHEEKDVTTGDSIGKKKTESSQMLETDKEEENQRDTEGT